MFALPQRAPSTLFHLHIQTKQDMSTYRNPIKCTLNVLIPLWDKLRGRRATMRMRVSENYMTFQAPADFADCESEPVGGAIAG